MADVRPFRAYRPSRELARASRARRTTSSIPRRLARWRAATRSPTSMSTNPRSTFRRTTIHTRRTSTRRAGKPPAADRRGTARAGGRAQLLRTGNGWGPRADRPGRGATSTSTSDTSSRSTSSPGPTRRTIGRGTSTTRRQRRAGLPDLLRAADIDALTAGCSGAAGL